ncbi:MAG TPA: hypothetical protein VJK09_00085 [Candidatus Paceibacterota bacterium]
MKNDFLKYAGAVAICLSVVGMVSAATTISTDISTGGTLAVTGASTLTGAVTHSASTTLANDLWFSEAATSTVGFATAGLNFDSSTFVIDPNSNMVGILTATPATALEVAGTASSTNTVVGGGTSLAKIVSGICQIPATTVTASSSAHADCTATGIAAGDRVFLQATSSLAANFIIQSASSSAAGNINLRIFNTGHIGGTAAGPAAIYYWAVR